MQKVYTVTELNSYIKTLFEGDKELSAITLKGEISNFINHRSGHMYFSLKDGDCQIKAAMFKNANSRLTFLPENGVKVIVSGAVTVYPRDGVYQFYVYSMQKDGVGGLLLAYEELKKKLATEGLFDAEHKKRLPTLPHKIGVITSSNGAAIKDIMNVVSRRCPITKIVLYPAMVQGIGTEDSLIEGLDYFETRSDIDLVIIGRGGGSIEDLWGFNSEKLARRIYDFNIPIISAVGHEIDYTICDFVSDKRAPTPSAAAELAVPDLKEMIQYLDMLADRALGAINNLLKQKEQELLSLSENGVYRYPKKLYEPFEQTLNDLIKRASISIKDYLTKKEHELALVSGKINLLSPLNSLSRGYALVTKEHEVVKTEEVLENGKLVTKVVATQEQEVIKTVKSLNEGDKVTIRVFDGKVKARII